MYKVIKFFCDLQDNNHAYNEGDTFPRAGLEVTEKRLAELASDKNKLCVPLIEKVDETPDVEKMTVPQLKEYAKEKNIELDGATAKAEILEKIKAAETAE